jgi:hypothetical protein
VVLAGPCMRWQDEYFVKLVEFCKQYTLYFGLEQSRFRTVSAKHHIVFEVLRLVRRVHLTGSGQGMLNHVCG